MATLAIQGKLQFDLISEMLIVTMPKKRARKEHIGTLKKPKLFPKNQLQMQHSKLLMVPENLWEKITSFIEKKILFTQISKRI